MSSGDEAAKSERSLVPCSAEADRPLLEAHDFVSPLLHARRELQTGAQEGEDAVSSPIEEHGYVR